MSTIGTLNEKIKAIADAIRAKTGSADSMTMDEMVVAIQNMSSKPSPTSCTGVLCDLFGVDGSQYPYIVVRVHMSTSYTFPKFGVYFARSVTQKQYTVELDYDFKGFEMATQSFKTSVKTTHSIEQVCDYVAANVDSFTVCTQRPVFDRIVSFTPGGGVLDNSTGYIEYYFNFDDMGYVYEGNTTQYKYIVQFN